VRGRNVLFFGYPRSEELRGAILPAPPGLSLSSGAFSLDKAVSSTETDCLFVVYDAPRTEGKLVALFLQLEAGSKDAALSAARKISHYGQYSYLAFAGDVNRAKGTWEPSRSPLIHDFAGASGTFQVGPHRD
jgi:hypothetical protein